MKVWQYDWAAVIHTMHANGINMRYAGKVYGLLRCHMWQRRFMLEMAARAIKVSSPTLRWEHAIRDVAALLLQVRLRPPLPPLLTVCDAGLFCAAPI